MLRLKTNRKHIQETNYFNGGRGVVKGKNYANRKRELDRPLNDFYPTPFCMVEELVRNTDFPLNKNIHILDPCCGKYAIGDVLRKHGYKNITERDIMYGDDFLKNDDKKMYDVVVMNPPFKLFDQFVEKAKRIADEVWCIGKANYFGAHSRNVNGLWDTLDTFYVFDRMIAFDIPEDDEGKVECGMMVTGWFYWKKSWRRDYSRIKVLDMQKYIKKKAGNK